MTVRIVATAGMFAFLATAGVTASAETYSYTYKAAAYMQPQERNEQARVNRDAVKLPIGEEEMEYRALVEPKEEPSHSMQPGDVAVQWKGPKMKISLGL